MSAETRLQGENAQIDVDEQHFFFFNFCIYIYLIQKPCDQACGLSLSGECFTTCFILIILLMQLKFTHCNPF